MNTFLDEYLRDSGVVRMTRPIDAILERGDQLRRRRGRGVASGVGAIAMASAFAVSMLLPAGSSPLVPPAVASWSGGGETGLSSHQLGAIRSACLEKQVDDGWLNSDSIPRDSSPLAAESRNGTFLAYWHQDGIGGVCMGRLAPDGSVKAASMRGVFDSYEPLPEGTHLGRVVFGASALGDVGGPVGDLWSVSRVSPQVDHVTVQVGDKAFEGSVIKGVLLFWATEAMWPVDADRAVITAYDSYGEVLARTAEAPRFPQAAAPS